MTPDVCRHLVRRPHECRDCIVWEEENERICEELLGWERVAGEGRLIGMIIWKPTPTTWCMSAPTFETWTDAGLILDAMMRIHIAKHPELQPAESHCLSIEFHPDRHETVPAAIRAGALAYLDNASWS